MSIIAGALLFMLAAFYNGYPLVTSDSGAYIGNFYVNMLPHDRPIVYSLFIFFSSFHYSTWTVIFVQSLWLAVLIRFFAEIFFDAKRLELLSFCLFIILALFTPLSWYSSQLMADIFTPIGFLAAFIYLFNHKLSYPKRYFLLFTFFIAGIMHNSNVLIHLGLSIGLFLLYYFRVINGIKQRFQILIAISIFSIVLFFAAHYIGGYGLTMSRSGHVFLMGKMAENGILDYYLEKECKDNPILLCAYRNKLPMPGWEFVWSSESPHMKTASWADTKPEYNAVLKDVFFSAEYLFRFLKVSARDSYIQFFMYKIGSGLNPHLESSSVYNNIKKFYPNELDAYMSSKQSRAVLHVDLFNTLYFYFMLLSAILLILIAIFLKIKPQEKEVSMFVGLFLFLALNAVITASFANILSRMQSRVVWLIPLAFYIILIRIFISKRKNNEY
ncbi:MAG: hypothetical protein WD048_05255 [Chitinophagales bacterium]